MKTIVCAKITGLAALSVALATGSASAGTITVVNQSSIAVPETRVYKTCLGAFASQIFGNLDPGGVSSQDRTSPVLGACVWAREVGVDPQQPTCFASTNGSEPAQITVTWFGDSADTLGCAIAVNDPPSPGEMTAPSGLTAQLVGSNSGTGVQLSWFDNSSQEQSFELQRRTDTAIFITLATLGPDSTAFFDGYADHGHTYTYRVRACTSGGCSAFSNEVSITP